MINTIFILDKSMKIVDTLSNNGDSPKSPFFDDLYVQEMATGAETFEFSTISNERTSEHVVAGNYAAFRIKNKVKVFQIIETNEEHNDFLYKSCYCEIAGLELINEVIRPREIPSVNIKQLMTIALENTGWKLGAVDAFVNEVHTVNIDKSTNVYTFIQDNMKKYNFEIEYRFQISHNQVTGKYIDIYSSRGRETRKRFEYGENVSGVSKKVDMSELVTALIGSGSNNIDFKSIEWGKNDPTLKPLNQDFVEDKESYKIWNNNGSHIMGVYETETDSPAELLKLTWQELQRRKQPKITYDVSIEMIQGDEEEMSIGDLVYVIDNDYSPALHLSARVGKLEISFTDYTKNKCTLTNFKDIKSGVLSLETIQAIIDGKFPITSENIADGAITEGKIDTQYLHTIKTDVIIAAKAEVEELIADKANIKDLEATNAKIENLEAANVTITGKLEANEAQINNLKAENVTITGKLEANEADIDKLKAQDVVIEGKLTANEAQINKLEANHVVVNGKLEATEADINLLKADVAEIDTLLAGNITADNIQAGSITSNEIASGTITAGSGIIADGAIGSAQISSLDAAKINAGTIDTSRVTVAGPNSNLKMSGNRLQVFTGIGSGQVERVSLGDVNGDGSQYGLLIRGTDGKTVIMDENGVTNAGITNGSITNEKISGNANIDGAKININSVINRINADGSESIQGTKIDIEGTSLSTKLSNITTTQTAQGKTISEHSSKIAANESAINLKVDSQTYQSDKEGIETQLNKNTADIALNKESIALKVEQTDINKAKSELEGKIDTKVNAAKSEIKVTTDKISQNVSNLTTTVNNKADGSTVSSLSNKVGSLETSVNGIKGQVSSLETTTTSINSTATNALNKATSANTAASNAQTAASNAQNTADSKAKVFTSTPTTPYKVGDIWTAGPSGDLMKCKTARASGSYTASDWEKASKYTDDTKANAVDGKVNTLQGEVNTVKSNVATLDINLQGITQRVSSTESTTTTLTSKVNTAQSTADAAKSAASTAQSTANTAKNNAATAQTAANNAQSTADSKAKVFTSTPTVPYKVGDLWTGGPSGDVMRCKTARTSGSYTASDWEKASKYTDDTKANAANNAAQNAQNTANTANATANANKTEIASTKSKVSSIETNLSSITSRVSTVETKQTTTDGKVTSLETWKKSAEQKITDSAIVSTVKAAKDTNGKNTFAQQSDITQLNNSWTATFKEGYNQGIVTMNKDGITVSNSNSNTKTIIDSSSFSVEDLKGGTVAEFAADSYIPSLVADTIEVRQSINAPNILKTQNAVNYYIDLSSGSDNKDGLSWTTAFKTIQKALDSLEKHLEGNIVINIKGTGSQSVNVWGFSGERVLKFYFENGTKLFCNQFDIIGCSCDIQIVGNDAWSNSVGQIIQNDSGSCIYVKACRYVRVYHLCICGAGKGQGQAINATHGSTVYLDGCEIDRFKYAIYVVNTAIGAIVNTNGSDMSYITGGNSGGRCYIQNDGTMPNADTNIHSNGAFFTFGGSNIKKSNGTIYTSTSTAPPPPATTTNTRTWSFNKIYSDETLNGWPDKSELIQGYASTWNTGRWTGYMKMTDNMSSIKSTLSGATNLSGRIYLQRRTTAGNSTGSKVCLYASDGTVITTSTTLDRGKSVWISIPSAVLTKIQSGAITYFYVKADSNNASTYIKYESNPKIEITYKK